jgi:phosphomannomutase
MTLIRSISGIRGTIGGIKGDNLTPPDILRFTMAYAEWLSGQAMKNKKLHVVIGRDARVSGPMVSGLISNTLIALGIDVTDLGLATTPTTEMAVVNLQADGGIIITASHNHVQWNALKLLNGKGEFLSAADGERLLALSEDESALSAISFSSYNRLGKLKINHSALEDHIQAIINHPATDVAAIQKRDFRIAIDCINSVGGIAVPALLRALGVKDIIALHCNPDGIFAHNPEPLPENLSEIAEVVQMQKADLGLVVDPDVDRLAIVCEDGSMFGEEYTLVAVADYFLGLKSGNTVSNLSSSRALRDITEKHGGQYNFSAVGEVNVVNLMKQTEAVIGGEGNGGVIIPDLHYGRDALAGIALFLTHLAKSGVSCLTLRKSYPDYFISKNKIEFSQNTDISTILEKLKTKYIHNKLNETDGLRIDFEDSWVHIRRSNTEPVIRVYAEAPTEVAATKLAGRILEELKKIAIQ